MPIVLHAQSESNPRQTKNVLLITRPIDATSGKPAEEAWCTAIINAITHFRFNTFAGVTVVSPETMSAILPKYLDLTTSLNELDYEDVVFQTSPTLMIMQRFEVLHGGKTINYSAECITMADKKAILSVEKTFPVDQLGTQIDSCILEMIKEGKLGLTPEQQHLFKIPLVSTNGREIKQLGEIIVLDKFTKSPKHADCARDYKKLYDKSPSLLLAAYNSALSFSAANMTNEALGILAGLRTILSEYTPLYFAYSQILMKVGNYQEALSMCQAGLYKDPSNIPLLLQKALALEMVNRSDEALSLFSEIISVNKNEPNALLFFARYSNTQGKPAEALAYVEKLLNISETNAHAYYEKGKALVQLHKDDDAAIALNVAVRRLPFDPVMQALLAETYVRMNKYQSAFEAYTHCIEERPQDLVPYLKVVSICKKMNTPGKALELLKRAEPRFSTNENFLLELGLLEHESGEVDAAQKHLTACIGQNQRDGRLFIALGEMYEKQGSADQAEKMYQRALTVAQDINPIRISLARLLIRKKDPMAALDLCKLVITSQPDFEGLNRTCGDAWLLAGDSTRALDFYTKERKRVPADAYVQERVALLTFATGNIQAAMRELEAFVKLDSSKAWPYFCLAQLYMGTSKEERSDQSMQRGLTLGKPDQAQSLAMARLYKAGGRYPNAINFFSSYLNFPGADQSVLLELAESQRLAHQDSARAQTYLALYTANPTLYAGYCSRAGLLFDSLGLISKAKTAFDLCLQKGIIDYTITFKLVRWEFTAKNCPRVVTLLKDIPQSVAVDDSVCSMAAECHVMAKNLSGALVWLNRMGPVGTTWPRTLELKAQCYEQNNDPISAIDNYTRLIAVTSGGKNADYAFHCAELFEKAGNIDSARNRYVANTQTYPQDLRNFKRAAELFLAARSWAKAQSLLEPAVTGPNPSSLLLRLLAQALMEQKKSDAAAQVLERYCAQSASDSQALYDLGSLYFGQRKFAQALVPFKKAGALMPGNPLCLYKTGVALCETNNYAEAIGPLSKAAAIASTDAKVFEYLTRCYRAQNDTNRVIETLTARIQKGPALFDLRFELGSLLLTKNRTNDALVQLQAAAALSPSTIKVHKVLAAIAKKTGNDSMELAELKAALACTDLDADVHAALARYYSAKNDLVRAEPCLKRTLELDNRNIWAAQTYAILLQEQGKNAEAMERFSKALALAPENALCRVRYAYLLSITGSVNKALLLLDAQAITGSSDPAVLYWAALTFLQAQDNAKAIPLLVQALTFDKKSIPCYEALGAAYLEQSNFKQSVKTLMSAWEIGGYKSSTVFMLAKALTFDGKYNEARDFFKIVLSKEPLNEEVIYRLSHLYLIQGKLADAQIVITPDGKERKTGWVHLALGEIYEVQNKYDAAWIEFNVALRLLPNEAQANAGYGRICLVRKEFDDAIVRFSQAIAKDPNNLQYYIDMGKAYEAKSDVATALDLYHDVFQKNPHMVEAFIRTAAILEKKNNPGKVLDIINQARAANPDNADLCMIAGREYLTNSQFDKAIESYKNALSNSNGMLVDAYKFIGNAYYSGLTDNKKAREYYIKFTKNGGNDKTVSDRLLEIPEQ